MKRIKLKLNVWIICGVVMLIAAGMFTVSNLTEENNADIASQNTLEVLIPTIEHRSGKNFAEKQRTYPDKGQNTAYYILNPNMDMPIENIDGEEYIGILEIPDLDIILPVMSEWDYAKLKTAPCRYCGSVYKNDMIVCAHNYDRHFGRLKTLNQGADVYFTDVDGNMFSYLVTGIETIRPYDVEGMKKGDWDLTLFTCTIGGATRVAVRCEKNSAGK